ncbi:unnamed protein product, partial [Chrysoparadoxa australica]
MADALKESYVAAEQGHLISQLESLEGDRQQSLRDQLEGIDPSRVTRLLHTALGGAEATAGALEPVPSALTVSLAGTDPAMKEQWESTGMEAIKAGEVCVVCLAGGQGTRLGYGGPKGMYDIGLPSGKTLFCLQAHRLRRLAELCGGRSIPWYIMTSSLNDGETKAYFKLNRYFGVPSKDVSFFSQGTLPCFAQDGKIILES